MQYRIHPSAPRHEICMHEHDTQCRKLSPSMSSSRDNIYGVCYVISDKLAVQKWLFRPTSRAKERHGSPPPHKIEEYFTPILLGSEVLSFGNGKTEYYQKNSDLRCIGLISDFGFVRTAPNPQFWSVRTGSE